MSTVSLDYLDGLPAWRLRIVQPERFKDVPRSLHVRLFRLPHGSVLALLLKLYDHPEQPYFVHRVVDLGDANVLRHVEACARLSRMLLVFEPMGQSEGFEADLPLNAAQWRRCLRQGREHGGTRGREALDAFLKVFRPVSEKEGIEPAWAAVARAYPKPRALPALLDRLGIRLSGAGLPPMPSAADGSHPPAVRLVDAMLREAVRRRVRSVRLVPGAAAVFALPDGRRESFALPQSFYASVLARLKVLAGLDLAQKSLPQRGHIPVSAGRGERVVLLGTQPAQGGERVLLRPVSPR